MEGDVMTNFVFVPPLAYSPPAILAISKDKKEPHIDAYRSCTPDVLRQMGENIILVCCVSSALILFPLLWLFHHLSTMVRGVVTCSMAAMEEVVHLWSGGWKSECLTRDQLHNSTALAKAVHGKHIFYDQHGKHVFSEQGFILPRSV